MLSPDRISQSTEFSLHQFNIQKVTWTNFEWFVAVYQGAVHILHHHVEGGGGPFAKI